MKHARGTLLGLLVLAAASGCSSVECTPGNPGSDCDYACDASSGYGYEDASTDPYSGVADAAPTTDALDDSAPGDDVQRTEDDRVVEELDLFKLVGDILYVHGTFSGLNVIDVADPQEPRLVAQMAELSGPAAELFVRDGAGIMLLESSRASCPFPDEMNELGGTVTLDAVDVATQVTSLIYLPAAPSIAGTYCLPGQLLSSRVVGDILYTVTTVSVGGPYGYDVTWLLSVDLSEAAAPRLADHRVMEGASREIHVTPSAIFVAQANASYTDVEYIDISDPTGLMLERGSITVTGAPQGRWHMDAHEGTFRIVTYSGMWSGTNLHVIDITDPDELRRIGSIEGLADDEELWATRFVGDKVYVVTYRRWVYPSDPLWVISLEDPRAPVVQGYLEIPGWSNFIYPRGDRLLAAGRGELGRHVALSLYDVSDPASPREIERLDIGEPTSTSEVNEDHRGITVIENEAFGERPLIVIPYTTNVWVDGLCTPRHHIQLVELLDYDLYRRGLLVDDALGRVVRTVPVQGRLYSISDRLVGSIDVTDRSAPVLTDSVFIGDPGAPDPCLEDFPTDDPPDDGWWDDWPPDDDWDDDDGGYDSDPWDEGSCWDPCAESLASDSRCHSGCSVAPRAPAGAPWLLLLVLASLLAASRRR